MCHSQPNSLSGSKSATLPEIWHLLRHGNASSINPCPPKIIIKIIDLVANKKIGWTLTLAELKQEQNLLDERIAIMLAKLKQEQDLLDEKIKANNAWMANKHEQIIAQQDALLAREAKLKKELKAERAKLEGEKEEMKGDCVDGLRWKGYCRRKPRAELQRAAAESEYERKVQRAMKLGRKAEFLENKYKLEKICSTIISGRKQAFQLIHGPLLRIHGPTRTGIHSGRTLIPQLPYAIRRYIRLGVEASAMGTPPAPASAIDISELDSGSE
ncbi:hypothetical protein DFJ77DRAFT_441274 [Powellomyces hirtus]|nr:hypothetical protein DFJ77DRAFT_441274 [Powellomyces hirtus]